jgi:hypothetical protein
MSVLLSSCAHVSPDLRSAARSAGAEAAANLRVDIGRLPDECYLDTPRAASRIGMEAVSVLKKADAQLRVANQSKSRCVKVHDDKRANLLRGSQSSQTK